MKKTNIKMKQYSVVALLVVISIVLVGLIYSTGQKNKDDQQLVGTENQADDPTVDEIDYSVVEIEDNIQDTEDEISFVVVEDIVANDQNEQDGNSEIIVEPIDVDENTNTEINVADVEEIDVPVSEEPVKPETTSPEEIPETSDDLTDPDHVPEYDEEETTYVPEPEPEIEVDEVRGSNLVPDSENPFLQDDIPSNGDGGEIQGEDLYQDGVPAGEGDKF